MSATNRQANWGIAGRRWLKFSLVGGVGIGVQLATLVLLTAAGVHYLLATVLAVEAAVLHNFTWHQNFTWGDREGAILGRLARFHLSNGAISISGNLLLMRLLVGYGGMATVPANLLSIAACFVANFLAADRVVFLPRQRSRVPAACPSEAGAHPRDSRGNGGAAYLTREWASPMSSTVRCEKGT